MYVLMFDKGNRKLRIEEKDNKWAEGIFASKDATKCKRAYWKAKAVIAAKSKTQVHSPEFEEAFDRFSRGEIVQLFPHIYVPYNEVIYSPERIAISPSELSEGEEYIVRDVYTRKWNWITGVSYGGFVSDFPKEMDSYLIYADQITELGAEELLDPINLL